MGFPTLNAWPCLSKPADDTKLSIEKKIKINKFLGKHKSDQNKENQLLSNGMNSVKSIIYAQSIMWLFSKLFELVQELLYSKL